MTYADLFSEIKTQFMHADVSDIHEHLAYQYNITGEGEGIFYVEVKDGQLHVEPYEYYDRDVIFTCTAETLLQIAQGKLDPVEAFTQGLLGVEGNFEKALQLKELIDRKNKLAEAAKAAKAAEEAKAKAKAPVAKKTTASKTTASKAKTTRK